jgi:hypothetical protein
VFLYALIHAGWYFTGTTPTSSEEIP